MTTLLHASDPHFGTERGDAVEALVRLSARERPDVLVLSGDITQRARAAQFTAAWRFVERLEIPHIVAIPGNHDIPLFNVAARLFAPYGNYARVFGDDLEPEHVSDDLLVVAVDTTRRWRHKHGEISEAQIARVAHRLRAATPRQLKVVVTHQPVHVVTEQDRRNLVRNHEAAIAAWARAGAHLVLGGHIHHAHAEPVANGVWSVLAGTAVSTRVRDGHPNSVNLIRYANGLCAVERWDFIGGEFERSDTTAIEIQRARAAA